jgi:hypothetical protein
MSNIIDYIHRVFRIQFRIQNGPETKNKNVYFFWLTLLTGLTRLHAHRGVFRAELAAEVKT